MLRIWFCLICIAMMNSTGEEMNHGLKNPHESLECASVKFEKFLK